MCPLLLRRYLASFTEDGILLIVFCVLGCAAAGIHVCAHYTHHDDICAVQALVEQL